MTKQRAWIGTYTDGSEHRYLIETEIAPDAEAALRWVRDTWCMPVVAMRDQLNPAERAEFREWVGDMIHAMATQ